MTAPVVPTAPTCEAPEELVTPVARAAGPATASLVRDDAALARLRLVAIVRSNVERQWFPTDEAYEAEAEVIHRAEEVLLAVEALGIPAKLYAGDGGLLAAIAADRPDLILNLVDTLRGRDSLQMSVPAALELTGVPYTGAGVTGLVIGNDRNLTKQLLFANAIPTPSYQFVTRSGTPISPDLGLPLIVKLNEGGGSVGIANDAVKDTLADAQEQADRLCASYRQPVVVERFIPGPELAAVLFDDGESQHVFVAEKIFRAAVDGEHRFTSYASYNDPTISYDYRMPARSPEALDHIAQLARRAHVVLRHRDYAKYDIRIGEDDTPYFIDCNPNTAFGPDPGLPLMEVVALYGLGFPDVLASLLSKYARKLVPLL